LAAARNAGIARAAGEFFQFLDADDLLESEKLERQVEFLQQHTEIDIVFSEARYFRSENMAERRLSPDEANVPWVVNLSARGIDVLQPLVRNNIMVVNSPLLRRSVITDVGLFDGTVKGVEDWDYWIRCAIKGKHFHYADSDGTRALVRVHGESMSQDGRMMLRSTLLMHRKVSAMVLDTATLQLNRQRMAEREGFLGIEEVCNGELLAGIRQLCRAARMDRNIRQRAKWLFCAACAPFVSHQSLRKTVTTPVGRSLTGFRNGSN
jgi:glycosyltransferase involved in cell wall biosynthesis